MSSFDKGYWIGWAVGVAATIFFIVIIWDLCPENPDPPPTPNEYTKNGMTYIEFPRGSVANYTLDSMAKESRVILQYQQIIKPNK